MAREVEEEPAAFRMLEVERRRLLAAGALEVGEAVVLRRHALERTAANAGDAYVDAFRRHLLANHALVQALLPGMRAANWGRIVNVVSTSVREPIPNLGVSNTIRGAVASWAKTLSRELAPFGITVNNVLPGYTATARLDAIIKGRASRAGVTPEEIEMEMKGTVPARRFGEPAEIAAVAGFLATPAAAYVNGVNLPVDGGRLAAQ